MTYFDLLNKLFAAHRAGDVIQKYLILEEMEERKNEFADTLDALNL